MSKEELLVKIIRNVCKAQDMGYDVSFKIDSHGEVEVSFEGEYWDTYETTLDVIYAKLIYSLTKI